MKHSKDHSRRPVLPAGLVLRPIGVLLLAGGAIGLFHHRDLLVAVALGMAGAAVAWRMLRRQSTAGKIVLTAGMAITGILGVGAELWGISNGYWVYHDLSGSREFPYWLPVAWMLAFLFLYRVELRFIQYWRLYGLRHKLLLAALVSMLFPTWGEMVTINLGVWSYRWGAQIFGVPLLAIVLLMVLHLGIYLLFTLISRLNDVADPVFGYRTETGRGVEIGEERGDKYPVCYREKY